MMSPSDKLPPFFVVDADGNVLRKPKKYKRSKRPGNPMGKTLMDLAGLEEAIFKHADYREMFLDVCQGIEKAETIEEYLSKFNSRKHKALVSCWELGWRPSQSGDRVIDSKNNPYIKK